jgi:hypothetical protein
VKDKLIAQGNWPGKAGPRVNTEDEDFKVVGGGLCGPVWTLGAVLG